jgi:RHH-type proline utilization regulon transcriptional repressor/proline dehydrogenase/delta 1-pyrroline-5-carboxylate dehydrogenase
MNADELFDAVRRNYLADEAAVVGSLIAEARTTPEAAARVRELARNLVTAVRTRQRRAPGLAAFLQHYDLSSREGVVLMCLAESLLRIPDPDTADRLIADKLTSADWKLHIGRSDSLFVNASTWALMLTGRIIEIGEDAEHRPGEFLARLLARIEEPVVRAALRTAMDIMARQFVMGRTIEEALQRAQSDEHRGYRHSFDMLGEAALTRLDADRYQAAYAEAIAAVGAGADQSAPLPMRPSISIKLSALCPRYEYRQREQAVRELAGTLLRLCRPAREAGIAVTIDAEEADRLETMLEVFGLLCANPELAGWDGLGLAVQAYQKRALPLLDWLDHIAREQRRIVPVRLVKGAYWDTEIKRAQEQGLRDYPVFTRKNTTDLSFLACARRLLDHCPHLYPQFATHNAHTLAWIVRHGGNRDYEFQRLHGMGLELYGEVIGADRLDLPCRIYAPVGAHEALLPYLVRRLLENGANTSFVNMILHEEVDIGELIVDPADLAALHRDAIRHPAIPVPAELFGAARRNSAGVNFADRLERDPLLDAVSAAAAQSWRAAPLAGGETLGGETVPIRDPARSGHEIGSALFADEAAARRALDVAASAWAEWNAADPERRGAILDRAADLFEERRAELMARCVREGGRTIIDAHNEVREAVDFLRYYAAECRRLFASPQALPGPTGESNTLRLTGRGVFLCISPWNFPVAIFTGQIAAALAAGNAVIAKPAEQTPLTAQLAVDLLYEAGVPADALAFLPGDGPRLGSVLLPDPRIAGVAFTGSTAAARAIHRRLAEREGAIPVLIAETGGLNAMIADSSALPEQLVPDVVLSAFNSAGQRCSALRVLYLQQDIAGRVLEMLAGHMDELVIGEPMDLATDIGPVIGAPDRERLETHLRDMQRQARILHRCVAPPGIDHGYYVPPAVVEIDGMGQLPGEVFGPILHVVRYAAPDLDRVIDEINASGYGLTLGVHSRLESTAEYIRSRVHAGNVYVNRNMIGAVVGVQPFGGCGLSGTGPKAGGPHYLPRFATEQTYTVNTAAVGGNTTLLSLAR